MITDTLVMDVSEDWAVASDVQQRFLERPRHKIPALSYHASCRQIRALGGDCYDFLPLSHNRMALVIGDASGKSLAAALMILSVQSSLRTAVSFAGDDAAAVVRTVNAHVHASSLAGRYATLFYGVFDGDTRTLRYVNGGHNPPIVIRRDGSIVPLEMGGMPVGMFASPDYQEGVVQLGAGDLIVAYTDGVTEVTSPTGEEWGVERLQESVNQANSRTPEDIACSIFRTMDEFSGGCPTDDATVLVARVH